MDDKHKNDQGTDSVDPGAFVGHEPEWAKDSIPGGVGPKDERVAAHSTRSTGSGAPEHRGQQVDPPDGHRQGEPANDDRVREAGQTG